jgi:hypothetical protein
LARFTRGAQSRDSLVAINRWDGSFATFAGLTKNGCVQAPCHKQFEEKCRFVRQSRSRSDWRSQREFGRYFSRPDSFKVGHTNNVQATGSPSGLQEINHQHGSIGSKIIQLYL